MPCRACGPGSLWFVPLFGQSCEKLSLKTPPRPTWQASFIQHKSSDVSRSSPHIHPRRYVLSVTQKLKYNLYSWSLQRGKHAMRSLAPYERRHITGTRLGKYLSRIRAAHTHTHTHTHTQKKKKWSWHVNMTSLWLECTYMRVTTHW